MHKNTPLVEGPELTIPPSGQVDQLEQDQIERLIAAYEAGATVYDVAAQFGIARQTVSGILKRHDVRLRRQGLSPEQIDQAARLYQDGWSLKRVGNSLGVDAETIRQRLREHGIQMRDAHTDGTSWTIIDRGTTQVVSDDSARPSDSP